MATSVESSFVDSDIISSSLTDSLAAKLNERREQWTIWLEREQQRCDETIEQHAQSLRQAQHRIDHTSQEILAYQVDHGLTLTTETSADEGNAQLQRELMEMKEALQAKKEELQQVKEQAEYEEERAQDSREALSQVQATAQTTLFHLTKANRHFEWAGLEIERAPNDCVRFKFTQLDPQDARRSFSVLLAVNPTNDLYEIHECEPPVIPSDSLSEMEHILNQPEPVNPMCDNFKIFAQHVRHAFVSSLVERTPMRR